MQWSVSSLDYHTPSAGSSWPTHTLLFFSFECGAGGCLCICLLSFFLFSLLLLLPLLAHVFRQGPHFRTMLLSLRFSPLLLVVDLDE